LLHIAFNSEYSGVHPSRIEWYGAAVEAAVAGGGCIVKVGKYSIPTSTLELECYVINGRYKSILLHIVTSLRKLGRRTTARTPYCWLSSGGGGKNRLRKSENVSPLDLPCNFLDQNPIPLCLEERTREEKALLLHIAIRLRKLGGRTTAQRSRRWLFSEGYRSRRKVGIAEGFRLCQSIKTEMRSDPNH
jgi:hypothetical protein